MFCVFCGNKISQEDSCSKCGSKINVENSERVGEASEKYEIFSPNASAGLSIIFGPVFGTFLHMKNWKALGNPEAERNSLIWLSISVILLAVFLALNFIQGFGDFTDKGITAFSFWVTVIWYFTSGKKQLNYVKGIKENVNKKSFVKPVLCGIFLIMVYGAIYNYGTGIRENKEILSGLFSYAEDSNKKSPFMSSEGVRQDRVDVSKEGVSTYYYTLVNINSNEVAGSIDNGEGKNNIIKNMCASNETLETLKRDFKYEFIYRSNDGNVISSIEVNRDSCGI